MGWVRIENPPQELLDRLLQQARQDEGPCRDCLVEPGKRHRAGCDTARCTNCGGQRLSCDCTTGRTDIWDGLWPHTMLCHQKGWVAKWEGAGVFEGDYTFDYNRATVETISSTKKPTPDKPRRKVRW